MGKFDGVQWAGRDLRDSELRGASLCGANLVGCKLDDADLRGVDLWGANLALISARRIDLRGARLVSSSFAGADLRGARLQGASLALCDFEGAHLACVDWGRERTNYRHRVASANGYPSFADALLSHPVRCSRMRRGNALLAIDAALEISPNAKDEIAALLAEDNWRLFAVGAMAATRRGKADGLVALLEKSLGRRGGHVAYMSAAALQTLGTKKASLLSRHPELGETQDDGPQRSSTAWIREVQRRLTNIAMWPSRDEQPAPFRSLF